MLHFVTTRLALEKLRPYLSSDDSVVFVDDGVYVATELHECSVYALKPHVVARGLELSEIINQCEMDTIVELVVNHKNSSTWT